MRIPHARWYSFFTRSFYRIDWNSHIHKTSAGPSVSGVCFRNGCATSEDRANSCMLDIWNVKRRCPDGWVSRSQNTLLKEGPLLWSVTDACQSSKLRPPDARHTLLSRASGRRSARSPRFWVRSAHIYLYTIHPISEITRQRGWDG